MFRNVILKFMIPTVKPYPFYCNPYYLFPLCHSSQMKLKVFKFPHPFIPGFRLFIFRGLVFFVAFHQPSIAIDNLVASSYARQKTPQNLLKSLIHFITQSKGWVWHQSTESWWSWRMFRGWLCSLVLLVHQQPHLGISLALQFDPPI